jgi:hypothetical protein
VLEKIIIAKDHAAKNKSSIIKSKIDELESQADNLFSDITIQCESWAESIKAEDARRAQ